MSKTPFVNGISPSRFFKTVDTLINLLSNLSLFPDISIVGKLFTVTVTGIVVVFVSSVAVIVNV